MGLQAFRRFCFLLCLLSFLFHAQNAQALNVAQRCFRAVMSSRYIRPYSGYAPSTAQLLKEMGFTKEFYEKRLQDEAEAKQSVENYLKDQSAEALSAQLRDAATTQPISPLLAEMDSGFDSAKSVLDKLSLYIDEKALATERKASGQIEFTLDWSELGSRRRGNRFGGQQIANFDLPPETAKVGSIHEFAQGYKIQKISSTEVGDTLRYKDVYRLVPPSRIADAQKAEAAYPDYDRRVRELYGLSLKRGAPSLWKKMMSDLGVDNSTEEALGFVQYFKKLSPTVKASTIYSGPQGWFVFSKGEGDLIHFEGIGLKTGRENLSFIRALSANSRKLLVQLVEKDRSETQDPSYFRITARPN